MATATRKKPVRLDHHHFGVSPDDPQFNIEAARQAHADVMRRWDDPVEGDDFKALMLHAIQNATAEQIETHRAEIQRFLDDFGASQKQNLSKAIVRSYVQTAVSAVRKDEVFERLHPRGEHGLFGHKTEAPEHPIGYRQQQPGQVDVAAHMALLRQAAAISAAAGAKGQEVQYSIRDKKGAVRHEIPKPGRVPRLKRGERLVGSRGRGISDDQLSMNDVGFNLIQALGTGAGRARAVTDATGRSVGAGMDFGRAWDAHANKEYGTDIGAAYTRIGAGAQALHTIAAGSPKAQAAVAVGRFVGKHGAEAEKVLGPHARKSAYKYRGLERKPRNLPEHEPEMSEGDYHDRLVARIAGHIPSAGVHALNLASGYTAPSHGYLLDKEGKVIAEAQGFGDDHYLPFKLSGLTRMKDGSYIRTRSTGGPTTEDVYASAISGGKKFTVASRQGTYSLEFDPGFTHNKRFGDIALGMSKRYGKILDAVQSGNVHAHGEVRDSTYQGWVEDGLTLFANDKNQVKLAHDRADKLREQQESQGGRTLRLDGEGYHYALQALQSQYPYYLKSVDYARPGDQRFWDVDAEGGHLERIGNAAEKDSGYVKPRHLKSADALLGYFDPTIAGAAKQHPGDTYKTPNTGVDITGTGKIRGDVAQYANWRHNPYNSANTPTRPGTPPTGARPATSQGNGGVGGVGGTNRVVSQSELRTGLDPDGMALHEVVKRIVAKDPQADLRMRQWAADRNEFMLKYNADKPGVTSLVRDHAADARLTNTSIPHRSDEQTDTGMTIRDQEDRRGVLIGFLGHKDTKDVRDKLQIAAAGLYHEEGGDKKYPDADPNGEADFYHHIPRKTLVETAFPPGTFNKAKLQEMALKLLREEDELNELQDQMGIPEDHPDRYHPWVDNEGGPSAQPSAEEKEAVGAHQSPADRAAQARFNHSEATRSAVFSILENLNNAKPDKDDMDEYLPWQRQTRALDRVGGTWEDLDATDLSSFQQANEHLGDLLREFPEVGRYKTLVDLPDGGKVEITLRDLHHAGTSLGKDEEETSKRWRISKRSNGRLTVRRVA